jgi:hypothetical protein
LDNWKFIIPAVIALWLLMPIVFAPGRPGWLYPLAGVACFLFIAGLVGFLLVRQTAWNELAMRYPARGPAPRPWRTCRTVVIARVPLDDPTFEQQKVRLVFILRLATSPDALYFSAIPPFGLLVPPLQIPWSAISRARAFDASGWVRSPRDPGALVQLTYDPGYTGEFLELQVREPELFIHLPALALGEATAYLSVDTGQP